MDPLLYEKVNLALRSDDRGVRAEAIGRLAELDGFGAARMILSHARREDDDELLSKLAALTRDRGLTDCADFIREQLEQANAREKVRILYISQFVKDPQMMTVAAEHFGDPDRDVTQAAWRIFGTLPKDRKISILGRLAMADCAVRRARALRGFAKFRNAEVVGYLARGLKDADYDVKLAAWEGLDSLRGLGVAEAVTALGSTARPEPALPSDDGAGASDGGGSTAMERNVEKGWICRTCSHISRTRPDGQAMSASRLWCSLIGKETLGNRTCPRGFWNTDGR